MERKLKEAEAIINGTMLSEEQSRAIRISLICFLGDIQKNNWVALMRYESVINAILKLINETPQ